MSSTYALSSLGTELQRGDGGDPEVFTKISEAVTIGGPGGDMETIDVTDLSSDGGYREYLASFLEAGEVTLELNFVPSVHSDLLSDRTNRVLRNFKLVFPDAASTSWTFSAYVKGINTNASVGEKLSGTITLFISGSVDYGL